MIALLGSWSVYESGSLEGVPAAATKDEGEGGDPIGHGQHLGWSVPKYRSDWSGLKWVRTVYKVVSASTLPVSFPPRR